MAAVSSPAGAGVWPVSAPASARITTASRLNSFMAPPLIQLCAAIIRVDLRHEEGDVMDEPTRLSRRNFLVTSGAGAAGVAVSGAAGGYTSAEMRALAAQSSGDPSTGSGSLKGISKWELDTPVLCVDLDKLE